jgi:hypothetical protein
LVTIESIAKILDACVLLSLAAEGLFTVKWFDIIQNEWCRNL